MIDFNADVNKALADLMAAAKEVGGQAFPLLVARTRLSGITMMAFSSALLVIIWALHFRVCALMREARKTDVWSCPPPIAATAVACVLSAILLAAICGGISDWLTPEATVIWRLLGKR